VERQLRDVVSGGKSGVIKLKFDPKFGGDDKRHDTVWVDPATLKVLRRQKYLGAARCASK